MGKDNRAGMPETEWKIDFAGWIITVMAHNYGQAKYRAWQKFTKEFDISFRDFVYSARQY